MAATRAANDDNVETAIYATAVHFPMTRVSYSGSSFTPCFQTPLYYLNQMDGIMASTRSWTSNCMGWVPPYSQIYVSILLYNQTMRAMEAAGVLGISESYLGLRHFLAYYPSDTLWIPGPLVSCFKNLACFSPNLTGFGNVTPALPAAPNWSRASCFGIQGPAATHLPNISVFFSRLYTVCAAAERHEMTQGMTQTQRFRDDTDGPIYLSSVFGQTCDNSVEERRVVSAPGAGLVYAGNCRLWQQAAESLEHNDLPPNSNRGTEAQECPDVTNDWMSFLRLDHNSNWFSYVAAMMAKYCQYWSGSRLLSECSPNGSAAGAVCLSALRGSDIFHLPKWNAETGEGDSTEHGNANQRGHYSLYRSAELLFNAEVALDSIPETDRLAAASYHFNLIPRRTEPEDYCSGRFWTITPATHKTRNISVYQGVRSTIHQVYHHDPSLYDSDD